MESTIVKNYTEETLAALLRSHKLGLPLLVVFPSSFCGQDVDYSAEVKPIFHCRRCSKFWNETHKTLSICYENYSYINEPVVPLTLSDATNLLCLLSCGKVFATMDLIKIFPLLKQALDENERIKFLQSASTEGNSIKSFVACIGGEMSFDNQLYPLGYYDSDGHFSEGGPPLVLNMSLLEASLYRKRAEEKTEINSNVLTKPPDGSMAALSEHRLNVSPISSQHGIVDQSADFIAQDQLLLKETSRSMSISSLNSIELKKRKNVFERIKETNRMHPNSSLSSEKVAENLRRIYNTRSLDRPTSPAVASLKYDRFIRKGSGKVFSTSQLCSNSAVNQTVWSKSGKPLKTTIPMSRVAHMNCKTRSSSRKICRSQLSDMNEINPTNERSQILSYFGSLTTPPVTSEHSKSDRWNNSGSTMQYYDGANIKQKMLHEFSNKRKKLWNKVDSFYQPANSNPSLSEYGDYENEPYGGRIKRYNSMAVSELSDAELLKNRTVMYDVNGNEIEITNDNIHIYRGDDLMKLPDDSTCYTNSKDWQDKVKKEYAAHERTTPADQSTEMSRHKMKSKKFNEKSPDGDKVLESNKDRTLSQTDSKTKRNSLSSMKRKSIGGRRWSMQVKTKKKHHRKHSYHGESASDFLSSLAFTPSFRFSYFEMPNHLKDYNKDMSQGNVTLSLEDLKQTPDNKEAESNWNTYMNLSGLSLVDNQS